MTQAKKLDRWILIGAGALVFLLCLVAAILEKPEQRESSVPSSYSTDSGGAKASYTLLGEMGYDVSRWERSPANLPKEGQGYVFILAEPEWSENFSQNEREIERFLATGGRVLITGYLASYLIPHVDINMVELPNVAWSTCNPVDASPLTRGGSIAMTPALEWNMEKSAPLVEYYCDKHAAVVKYPVGKGEVIWWAAPTPLTNAALKEQGNVQLLLGSIGAPATTHVLWDEYFHGVRNNYWEYAEDTPLKWIWWQLVLLAVAVLITFFLRSDPIQPHVEPSRLSPLEFVETLGGVYERAKAANIAVQIVFDRFRFLLCERMGFALDTPVGDLARAARNRLGYRNDSLESDLQAAQSATENPDLTPEMALRLTQSLHDHIRALKLISAGELRQQPSSGD